MNCKLKGSIHFLIMSLFFATLLIFTSPSVQAAGSVKSVSVTNVTNKKLSLTKNQTKTLNVKVTVTGKASKEVTYTSNNKSVATVTSKGKITAKKNGTAKITVTAKADKKKSTTITVTVTTLVTKVSLNKTSATILLNNTFDLNETITPTDASNKSVKWSSSDSNIASVNSKGVVTAKKTGSAIITATAKDGSDKKATCKVTVVIPVSKIILNELQSTLETGKTLTLKATVWPENASVKSVKWSSSNTSIATVNTNGIVTAKKAGTVTITAAATDGSSKKKSCTITVKDYENISFTNDITKTIDSETTKYYKFIPQKSGYYYFYVDGSNCKISLYNSTMDKIGLETIPSLHSKCYVRSLKAKSTYYLDISNSGSKQIAIGITNTRPDTRKISKTLSVEATVADTIIANQSSCYKFIPTETGKYYFYADGTDCDIFLSELDIYEGSMEINSSFILSTHTSCYSYTCKAGRIYYFSVSNKYDSNDNITAGITKTRPQNIQPSGELAVNKTLSDTIDSNKKYYKFTPTQSADYYFYIDGTSSCEGQIFNDNNINDGLSNSFISIHDSCYHYKCKANETYFLCFFDNASEQNVPIKISVTKDIPDIKISEELTIDKSITTTEHTFYKFTPTESTEYYFSSDELYDENIKLINTNFVINIYSGWRYYKLTAKKTYYLYTSYSTTLTITKSEPNINATTIPLNKTISDSIDGHSTKYYKFIPTKSTTYYFYVDGLMDYNTLELSTNNTTVDTISQPSSHSDCIFYTCKAGETYFLSVGNWNSSETQNISVGVTNTKQVPEKLKLNKSITENLSNWKRKYYQFTPTKTGTYYFYIDGKSSCELGLLNDTFLLEEQTIVPSSYVNCYSYELTANRTYYLDIDHGSGTTTIGVTNTKPSYV